MTTALALVCANLQGALLIDAGPSSTFQVFLGGSYVAGTEFTTASELTIRSMGWLDVEGDGLGASHEIGLWDAISFNLLASVTVTPSSATVLSAQGTALWFMENIPALTIGPGTYRVAGMVTDPDTNALSNDKLGIGVTLTAGYVRTDFPSGGFAFPNFTFPSEAIRATVSTTADGNASAVPEPTSFALAGLGLIGLAAGAFRRR